MDTTAAQTTVALNTEEVDAGSDTRRQQKCLLTSVSLDLAVKRKKEKKELKTESVCIYSPGNNSKVNLEISWNCDRLGRGSEFVLLTPTLHAREGLPGPAETWRWDGWVAISSRVSWMLLSGTPSGT